ncbi:hypothetical protein [Devosia alba]|uniref:hypothetical protein n=1 Tax=Devosia alba TaxID=3152360 RepID=UPI002C4B9635|nr:hypothetical protein [Devosia sp.]
MSKSITEKVEHDLATLDKTSGGGQLGGTEFGQEPGEAKVKHPGADNKARPGSDPK